MLSQPCVERSHICNSAEGLITQFDQVIQVCADSVQFFQPSTKVLEILALLQRVVDVLLRKFRAKTNLQALPELVDSFA
jgi:hypothetical protein